MLGEAWAAMAHLQKQLQELYEQREMVCLANDDSMHPFVFEKKMKYFDDLIARTEEELGMWQDTYCGLLHDEADELIDCDEADTDAFDDIFDELCIVDGVSAQEELDDVISTDDLFDIENDN